MSGFSPTARTEVRRLPKRGVYSRDEIYAILDDEEDLALSVWAGVVPVAMVPEAPIAAEDLKANVPPVDLGRFRRRR